VLLDRGQELLDLLGGQVVDGEALEEVLGGDEPPLASACGDLLLGLFEAEIAGRLGQRSPSMSALQGTRFPAE